jgi:hypothetical protein
VAVRLLVAAVLAVGVADAAFVVLALVVLLVLLAVVLAVLLAVLLASVFADFLASVLAGLVPLEVATLVMASAEVVGEPAETREAAAPEAMAIVSRVQAPSASATTMMRPITVIRTELRRATKGNLHLRAISPLMAAISRPIAAWDRARD